MPTERLDLRQADTSPTPDDTTEVVFAENSDNLRTCPDPGKAMGALAVEIGHTEAITGVRGHVAEIPPLSTNQHLELQELLKGVDDPSERDKISERFRKQAMRKNIYLKRIISQKGANRS